MSPRRTRTLIAVEPHGQPRTYRLAAAAHDAAYRRLAIAVLQLDVASLAHQLRSARRAVAHTSFRLARAA